MAIKFFNSIDVDGKVQGTSLDINGVADISGALVVHSKITGTELEGTSLDINGNADISGHIAASSLRCTNIVTNKVVKFNGTQLDDANITDTGSLITLGSNTVVSGELEATSLDINGNADISGNLNMAGNLATGNGNVECNDLDVSGTITGDGSSIDSINGSNIYSGTVAAARVATLNQNTTGSSGSCTGNAATATKISSITNTNIVQLATTTTQTGTKTFSGVIDITNTTASSNATGDTGALRCEGGASIAGKIYAGSTITGSADVIAFSDRKLKKNIETLDGKKVLDMRGVSFTRKDTGAESSGVIAQEIQKVAPELVHDTEGTLGVAYGNLVGYLIEAVKDQQKQIDELKELCSGCSK